MPGKLAPIIADTHPRSDEFCQWVSDTAGITDVCADVNEDGFVGQTDLDIVLDDWGKPGRQPL